MIVTESRTCGPTMCAKWMAFRCGTAALGRVWRMAKEGKIIAHQGTENRRWMKAWCRAATMTRSRRGTEQGRSGDRATRKEERNSS
jgi:hypothetical protein